MDELKAQITFEASEAARLSREATQAYQVRDWERGRALMIEALTASRNCHKLIKQLNENIKVIAQSK